MNLSIIENKLVLNFSFWEQVWSVRCQKTWEIPLSHITAVSTARPHSNWREIRAPGSFVPGVIKAGTYYTHRGKEFWYVTQDHNYLTLELSDDSYQRIILNVADNEFWLAEITRLTHHRDG